jgi:dTDP-4-amino-4,6-dideoxygalactose transaminase
VDCLRTAGESFFVIPWASPGAQYFARRNEIQAAIGRVLESGVYILGGEVEAFESAFADFCGVAHAVGVGSGTDAIILALRALDIGPGDEVVTVSHTALATVAAVVATGATPILVDVGAGSYTIDPIRLEEALSPRTKAVIAVHLYGQPADMAAINAIAARRGLTVIEDCAQAAGARCGNARVGSLGDIGCFSFYPTKNLGAIGDGGMVTTDDDDLAMRVRRLRQYGWNEMRETEYVGTNSRLDALQAAILGVKLRHLDEDNARRVEIAQRYNRGLAGLALMLPPETVDGDHVFHLYVARCEHREALRAHLAANQITSAVHYPVPVHRHAGYAEKVVIPKQGLPRTEDLVGGILSLPIYPELRDDEVDNVIGSIRRFYEKRA